MFSWIKHLFHEINPYSYIKMIYEMATYLFSWTKSIYKMYNPRCKHFNRILYMINLNYVFDKNKIWKGKITKKKLINSHAAFSRSGIWKRIFSYPTDKKLPWILPVLPPSKMSTLGRGRIFILKLIRSSLSLTVC